MRRVRLMTFHSLYAGAWQNPYAFWALGLGFLALLASRLPFLAGYFVVFLVEILGDALQSGALYPHLPLGETPRSLVAVGCVVLGDLRWLLLATRYARAPRPVLTAVALAFVVPVGTYIAMRSAPAFFADTTRFYALYEVGFLGIAAAFHGLLVAPRRAGLEPDVSAWLGKLLAFEVAQYALWVAADALILSGADVGWAVRLVPNFLYYAGFLPFALLTAPRRLLLAS